MRYTRLPDDAVIHTHIHVQAKKEDLGWVVAKTAKGLKWKIEKKANDPSTKSKVKVRAGDKEQVKVRAGDKEQVRAGDKEQPAKKGGKLSLKARMQMTSNASGPLEGISIGVQKTIKKRTEKKKQFDRFQGSAGAQARREAKIAAYDSD